MTFFFECCIFGEFVLSSVACLCVSGAAAALSVSPTSFDLVLDLVGVINELELDRAGFDHDLT